MCLCVFVCAGGSSKHQKLVQMGLQCHGLLYASVSCFLLPYWSKRETCHALPCCAVPCQLGSMMYLQDKCRSHAVSTTLLRVCRVQGKAKYLSMIAGGSGVTPCYDVAREVLQDPSDNTRMSLVYANKHEEDIWLRQVVKGGRVLTEWLWGRTASLNPAEPACHKNPTH